MTAPSKSWERKEFIMNQNPGGVEPVFGGTLGSQSADVPSAAGIIGGGTRPVITAPGPGTLPPPIPQRSHQNSTMQSAYNNPYSRYTNNYSSFGMGGYPYSSYGGFGGYSGYPRRMLGGYGMGYSGFGGYQDDYDASMMQAIDESCTTLFGPFDSLVRSISSIAMVLDSTHQAMQFSFRTVLSAADSLSKLKNLILELASSFSIIRLLRSLYYKVLRLLGLIKGSAIKEKEWSALFSKAGAGSSSVETGTPGKPSPWLALGFFSLMMGGPYLMFRLFAQNIKNSQPNNGLTVGPDFIEAIATYDFEGGTSQELSVKRGDRLRVSKSGLNQSWAVATNGTATGFVPTNRLQMVSARQQIQRNYTPMDLRNYTPTDQRNFSTQPPRETSSNSVNYPPETSVASNTVDPTCEPAAAPSENNEETNP